MLYGLPVGLDKLEDLRLLAGIMEQHDGILRLMVDNVGQIKALKRRQLGSGRPWSIFIKVDGGGRWVAWDERSMLMLLVVQGYHPSLQTCESWYHTLSSPPTSRFMDFTPTLIVSRTARVLTETPRVLRFGRDGRGGSVFAW